MKDEGCGGGAGRVSSNPRGRARADLARVESTRRRGATKTKISGEVFSPGRASRGAAPRACRTYEAWGALGDVGTDTRDGAGTQKQRGRCAGTVSVLGKNGAPRAFVRHLTRRALFSREKKPSRSSPGTLSQQTVQIGVTTRLARAKFDSGERGRLRNKHGWALSRVLRRGLRLDAPVRPRVPRHLSFFASARARCFSCARFAWIIIDAMSRRKFTSTTTSTAMRGTQNTVVVKTPCLSK
jgi:hypothetical protein